MPTDPSVIAALEQAVAASPDNTELRLHLAQLLVENDRRADAVTHAAQILVRHPEHAGALKILSAPAQAPKDNVVKLRVVGSDSSADAVDVETPPVTLADVAGMEEVKRRLNVAFLAPMRNPELRRSYGKSLRGGLLLYGPPGCGKTFIARATAGELGAKFISVGLSDVLDMYIGQSERNLHETFEMARRNKPCVLFFDEIDALGRKRSLMRHSSERNVVNQLLAELDNVDSALRRPGRLDRTLLVLPPDQPAREAILRSHLRDRPLAADVDPAAIAAKSEGYSGADVAHVAEAATEFALEDSLESGTPRDITQADLRRALADVKPSTRPWFDTARNYAQFANEGGMYDDLAAYLRRKKLL